MVNVVFVLQDVFLIERSSPQSLEMLSLKSAACVFLGRRLVVVPFTRHNSCLTFCRIIPLRRATINSHHITTSCFFTCKIAHYARCCSLKAQFIPVGIASVASEALSHNFGFSRFVINRLHANDWNNTAN